MENKFKKGLILGGLLAAVATFGFMKNHDGQILSDDLKEDLKTLAKRLKKRLHQMEDVTQERFDALVTTVVEEYAKKMEQKDESQKALTDALKAKWHEMEKEYLDEREEEMTLGE